MPLKRFLLLSGVSVWQFALDTGTVIHVASSMLKGWLARIQYVKIANRRIEIAGPSGQIEVKGNLNISGPAGGDFTFPNWSDAPLKKVKGNMNFGFSE
jgi:type VI secretion system secreted protein VgrG